MVPGSAASHHLGTWKKQTCRPDPRPTESETLGLGLRERVVWDVVGLSSRTDVAGACEPELPCTVVQAVHCTTEGDAIHAARMRRMVPPRGVQCKTCTPYLAVLKTVGNSQKDFNRGKTWSDLSVKRYCWHWGYLGEGQGGTTSSHSVPCISLGLFMSCIKSELK